MGEDATFAQLLTHTGSLKAIQEQVRFARARFGHLLLNPQMLLPHTIPSLFHCLLLRCCGKTGLAVTSDEHG
jgi:hypothetical protein